MESIPNVACVLDARSKHLQFNCFKWSSTAECTAWVNLVMNFIISESVQSEDVDDCDGEPVKGKKARLEQDFEQLFGPHFQSGRNCTADEEVCDYLQALQIPTMQNPLQWWA